MTAPIPLNRPSAVGREFEYMAQALAGGHISGDGPFTRRTELRLQQAFGAPRVLLTTSCTAALEMAAMLCGLGPGDEVVMPSFTFVSTANAVALRGATPIFVDIRADTLNIDERLIEAAITPRTRAIFPVHYAGVGCEMGVIMDIARRYGLRVVEDAAQGVFSRFEDRWLGTIGDLGCYSFHETKNISCGEGGALVVNDPSLIDRAEIIREKGTNRSQFGRGQASHYTWVDLGSSYILSDLLSAFLLGQVEHMERVTERRRQLFDIYAGRLAVLARRGTVRLPYAPENRTPNHHLFHIITADLKERAALIAHLKAGGVTAAFHYVPLHSSPHARGFRQARVDLPVTDGISARLLRLPLYFDLADEQAHQVADRVLDFYGVGRATS